jgi:outer membrane protein OmpA-like peptidoglycan-associated protein
MGNIYKNLSERAMKKTFVNFLFFILFSSLLQAQVNMSGEWKGNLYQEFNNDYKVFSFSMKLSDKDGKISGKSTIVNGEAYGIISLKGSVRNDNFTFEEFQIDAQKRTNNFFWCLKSGTLVYKKEGTRETLEGNWTGFIITPDGKKQDCSPGKLTIERMNDIVSFAGHVYDATTKAPLAATLSFTRDDNKETKTITSNTQEGAFRIETKKGNNFFVFVQCKGYLNYYDTLQFTNTGKDFYLEPIVIGKNIKLHNILFERGTPTLAADSYTELDRLADFLNKNPTIEIRLEGHTSNEGDEKKNLKLSEDRVKTVKDYLTEKGIATNRITLQGFGSLHPLVPNTTEENKKQNRRVEFKVTKS